MAGPTLPVGAIGVAAIALGAYTLIPSEPERQAPAAPRSPPPADFTIAPLPQASAEPPRLSTDGLTLYGVSGGGRGGLAAVIGDPAGRQRLVPVGRDYRPGLTVSEVGATYAILGKGSEAIRLELRQFAGASAASPAAPPPTAHPMSTASTPPGGAGRIDSAALHSGLRPVMSRGRIAGYAIKPGADLAPLQRAGLLPGDVIVGVNGSQFDAERMAELTWEMANSRRTELEFVRNGRRMKAAL